VSKRKTRKGPSHVEHTLADQPENRAALYNMAVALKRLREKHRIGQVELSELVGCSRSVIDKLERAQNFPSFSVYLSLVRTLNAGKVPLT